MGRGDSMLDTAPCYQSSLVLCLYHVLRAVPSRPSVGRSVISLMARFEPSHTFHGPLVVYDLDSGKVQAPVSALPGLLNVKGKSSAGLDCGPGTAVCV